MTITKKIGTGLAIGGLMFSAAAQASTRSGVAIPAVTPVGIEMSRASADLDSESEFAGRSSIIIAILALAAVIAGIAIAAGGDDDGDLDIDSPG